MTEKSTRTASVFTRRQALGIFGVAGGIGALALAGCAPSANGGQGAAGNSVLRVGIAGGTSNDNFDAAFVNGLSETTRKEVFYETLTWMDGEMQLQNWLLEEITPNATADRWTLKLKSGIEFHHGKTLDADDVMFTLQRYLDPALGSTQAASLSQLDLSQSSVKGPDEIELVLKQPFSILPEILANVIYILPSDYDPAKPVSTGPWKLKSFSPGQQTELERFDNYWGTPAGVQSLTLQELPDDAARVNALLSGQVDAINQVPVLQAAQLKGQQNVDLVVSETGGFNPITMRTDVAPFDDVRVRQALRLVMNRQGAVDNAIGGYGVPGGDVFGRYTPGVSDTPRERDVARARELLAESGHSDLTVELVASDIGAGILNACQILVENAKDAGITITLRRVDTSTYFEQYGQWPFAVDYWVGQPYLNVAALTQGPFAEALNVTHFSDPEYDQLFTEALSTLDADRRADLISQLTEIDADRGGNIVWAFQNTIDAYSTRLTGYDVVDKTAWGLGRCRLDKVRFA